VSDHSELRDLLISNEGNISHMYLDTVGRVTVGVGHMMPSVQAAQTIDFVNRQSQQQATSQQIADDFKSVSRQQPALAASRYQQFTKLELTASGIDNLLSADIAAMETGVRSEFGDYDAYPEPAQDGILDMAFNLGVTGLVKHFPAFKAAAERKDWNTCAVQCHRNGISEARNEKTKELFLRAAGATAATG
jgi:GH24 family phage-related lysozyme (muramidase)